jgi:hypothetical protein
MELIIMSKSFTHVDPRRVDNDNAQAAAEFDEILIATLPKWAAEMSEGYAWDAPIPNPADFENEAAALATHLANQYPD